MRTSLLVAVVAAIVAAGSPGHAQCLPAATTVAARFLRLDFDGAALIASAAHDTLRQLTEERVDRPRDPVDVIKSFEIVSTSGDSSSCVVKVRFATYGAVVDSARGEFFFRENGTEESTQAVNCVRASCRVVTASGWWPIHAGRIAVARWLASMEALARTPEKRAWIRGLRQRVEAVQVVTTITETEAQVLLYVSPIADTVRAGGGDVYTLWSEPSQDFYRYQLRDYKSTAPSNLVGNFAVNKRTAQVWDDDMHVELHSLVLSRVQLIIRDGHNIDRDVLRRYGGKKPSNFDPIWTH